MNRTWWTHLQHVSPLSLSACTQRFSKKFPKDWRRRIKNLTALEQYFYEMHKLQVNTAQVSGGALPFGFRIIGHNYKVVRNRQYSSSEEARWAALALCFSLLELEERRVQFVKPEIHQPVRRQPKAGPGTSRVESIIKSSKANSNG